MITDFKGKTAVLTGGASGFGLECARIGASLGMNLVLVDVQQDALDKAEAGMKAQGAQVLARKVDVSNAQAMEQLAADVKARFGAPNFVFNNAGVGAGGLLVFILAVGYYITPALVGGAQGQMISNLIAFHMSTSLNWSMAAAVTSPCATPRVSRTSTIPMLSR